MSCSKKIQSSGLLELIARGRGELSRAGIEEAQEECERILMKLLGCSRSGIYLAEYELNVSGVRESFLAFIEKRTQRIPLAYLLKETDFWQETLYVDERCLIPRPETEILVETVIREIKKMGQAPFSRGLTPFPCLPGRQAEEKVPDPLKQKTEPVPTFLDIGTGSGAIAVAILRACKNAQGTLLDISGEALEVAGINLEKYGLRASVIPAKAGIQENGSPLKTCGDDTITKRSDRARLIQGDLFGPFPRDEKWDLIVSNPPYLSEADWKNVQEELKAEPREALDGGKDGLDFYRRIVAEAKNHLTPQGLLALEVGQGQAEVVSTWLHDAGYDNIQRFRDYLGIERVVISQRGQFLPCDTEGAKYCQNARKMSQGKN